MRRGKYSVGMEQTDGTYTLALPSWDIDSGLDRQRCRFSSNTDLQRCGTLNQSAQLSNIDVASGEQKVNGRGTNNRQIQD